MAKAWAIVFCNYIVSVPVVAVIASVNYRTEPDVSNQFENLNIDWSMIEKQLIAWGQLFRSGKRLWARGIFFWTLSRSA